MAALSTYLRTKLADHVFRQTPYTPPATIYVSLHTANPTPVGTNEVAGSGYGRSAVPATALFWLEAAGVVTNNVLITFPAPVGSWGTISHFGLWDSTTGGNLLVYGALTAAKAVDEENGVVFPVSYLTVTFS